MLVVTSPDVRRHDPPHAVDVGGVVRPVWERPERVDALEAAVAAAGLRTTPAVEHDDRLLRTVHDPQLVDWLRDGHAAWVAAGGPEVMIPDTFAHRAWAARRPVSPIGEAGWWLTDTATPVVAGSWPAARAAVDLALTAVDLLVGGERSVHALTRPPGHHAGRAYAGGFCLVNHAAIAAESLREATGDRVVVLDVDHHHGNGTQEVFYDRADVGYVSIHADPASNYPWFAGFDEQCGAGRGRGTTLNLPLPVGIDDARYLGALDAACEAVASLRPAAVVLSLGTDTADVDPVGGLGLGAGAYVEVGRRIGQLGLPVVSVQEGGYDLDRVGADTVAVLGGLAELLDPPPATP